MHISDVIYRTDRINKRMREIKAEIERIQQETADNLDRIKQDATYNFELMKVTPSQIQEEIIAKQDQLILQLKEDNANEKAIRGIAERNSGEETVSGRTGKNYIVLDNGTENGT